MVYVVLNFKGGVGKSTLASNLIPEYILQKGKQKAIKLFEFDEYSQTSKDYLKNSELIESTIISEEEIERKILDIQFYARTEELILDVGPGPLVDKIITVANNSINFTDKLIFLIPYSDDAPLALLNTIKLIEETINNPKILVILNKIPNSGFKVKQTKKNTISLYGNEKSGTNPYKYLDKIDRYIRASVPYDHDIFTFAKAYKTSLVDLKKTYLVFKDITPDKLENIWRANANIKGESLTKDELIYNFFAIRGHLKATNFLNACSEFYEVLKNLENN